MNKKIILILLTSFLLLNSSNGKELKTEIFYNDHNCCLEINCWLTYNINTDVVIDSLGQPDSISNLEYWGGTGSYHQYFYYYKENLEINFLIKDTSLNGFVNIVKYYGTEMRIDKNVHIGDDFNSVFNKLQKFNIDTTKLQNTIIVCSAYHGSVLRFNEDTLSCIEIGRIAL